MLGGENGFPKKPSGMMSPAFLGVAEHLMNDGIIHPVPADGKKQTNELVLVCLQVQLLNHLYLRLGVFTIFPIQLCPLSHCRKWASSWVILSCPLRLTTFSTLPSANKPCFFTIGLLHYFLVWFSAVCTCFNTMCFEHFCMDWETTRYIHVGKRLSINQSIRICSKNSTEIKGCQIMGFSKYKLSDRGIFAFLKDCRENGPLG